DRAVARAGRMPGRRSAPCPRPARRSHRRQRPGAVTDPRDQGNEAIAIIVDNDTRLVVQGLTGSEGRFHGLRNRSYGTNVVAGGTPPDGGGGGGGGARVGR